MSKIARIAISSALPQLDKLFDYVIPDEMSVEVGHRVSVPFGRASKPAIGWVVSIEETSEFSQKLSSISSVDSLVPELSPSIYELCRAIADRQASTVYDLLKLALPTRSVRIEKAWLAGASRAEAMHIPNFEVAEVAKQIPARASVLAVPRMVNSPVGSIPGWVAQLVSSALEQLSRRKSSILVVPDFRDQNILKRVFADLGLFASVSDYSSDQTPSSRYAGFLRCLEAEPCVVIGSRSAIFAPVAELGLIAVFDDGDSSLVEPTSPYFSTRDVALVRQNLSGCNLMLCSVSRSVEAQRLIEIGYLQACDAKSEKPRVAISDSTGRVDSLAFQAIKNALDKSEPALVLVSNAGTSSSLFCSACSERALCRSCKGPLWLDSERVLRCRWCSAANVAITCLHCGSKDFRQGRAGVTRTASEFGKSFPGVKVIESSGAKRIEKIANEKVIVVSTADAQPLAEEGYGAVVILDAGTLLMRDSLRAKEDAVRSWCNAIALMRRGGTAVIVGLQSKLGQDLALWNLDKIASAEYEERKELLFPPFARMASLVAPAKVLDAILESLSDWASHVSPNRKVGLEVIGPYSVGDLVRYLIRYEYAIGAPLAAELKSRLLQHSVGVTITNSKSGRLSRAVKLKMDDAEVV